MPRMTEAEIESRLAEPHMCVFSVARQGKGPVAVPLSYLFRDGVFLLQTPPDSLHGRLAVKRGRATVTIHDEQVTDTQADEWYITAEGPVRFSDQPPRPVMRAILSKDRGENNADRWLDEWLWPEAEDNRILILEPDRLSGFTFPSRLEDRTV